MVSYSLGMIDHLLISLNMQIRSNMESPMKIPEILDLLAPIALEIITPRGSRRKLEEIRELGGQHVSALGDQDASESDCM